MTHQPNGPNGPTCPPATTPPTPTLFSRLRAAWSVLTAPVPAPVPVAPQQKPAWKAEPDPSPTIEKIKGRFFEDVFIAGIVKEAGEDDELFKMLQVGGTDTANLNELWHFVLVRALESKTMREIMGVTSWAHVGSAALPYCADLTDRLIDRWWDEDHESRIKELRSNRKDSHP